MPLTHPILLPPTHGESFVIVGGSIRILLDGTVTNHQTAIFECPVTPGDGPPLHRHDREDELFYILDGTFKFHLDGQTFIAEKGAFVAAPKGSVHTYKNIGTTPGTLLLTCTPAGIENAFRAIQSPPPGSAHPPLPIDQIIARLAQHGISILGPPLD